jgi:Uma2 family endonuclease
MVQVFPKQLTFEEYVDICNQTDEPYEWVRGTLRVMTPPTWAHLIIAQFLEQTLNDTIRQMGKLKQWRAFREMGQRTELLSSRLPDVAVVPLDAIAGLMRQTAILEVPAILVIEVVSPSSAIEDYTDKLNEYQQLSVLEYWVVDHEALGTSKQIGFPKLPTVTVYQLVDGQYQGQGFRGSDLIISPTFPEFNLSAEQILSPTILP